MIRNDAIDFVEVFGGGTGFTVTNEAAVVDARPCLPPVCYPVYEFCLIREEAPAAEATEAPCICY